MDAVVCTLGARGCCKAILIAVLLTGSFLLLPSLALAQERQSNDSPASFYAEDLTCKRVFGVFKAQSLPPDECTSPFGICSQGKLYGSLRATYEMTVGSLLPTGHDEIPFVNFFVGESTLTLKKGDVLIGIDSGSLNGSPPGTPGSGKFATLLTFVDGAVGYLYINGTTNLITGTTKGRYSGLVCVE